MIFKFDQIFKFNTKTQPSETKYRQTEFIKLKACVVRCNKQNYREYLQNTYLLRGWVKKILETQNLNS